MTAFYCISQPCCVCWQELHKILTMQTAKQSRCVTIQYINVATAINPQCSNYRGPGMPSTALVDPNHVHDPHVIHSVEVSALSAPRCRPPPLPPTTFLLVDHCQSQLLSLAMLFVVVGRCHCMVPIIARLDRNFVSIICCRQLYFNAVFNVPVLKSSMESV